jgi:hypothetical protein
MIRDYIHEFKAPNGVPSKCRIRLYEGIGFEKGMIVAIATQLEGDDVGMSVTNAAEYIATGVSHQAKIDPTRLIWIEHYPAEPKSYGIGMRREESFDRATFDTVPARNSAHDTTLEFRRPLWRRISRAEIVVATGEQP